MRKIESKKEEAVSSPGKKEKEKCALCGKKGSIPFHNQLICEDCVTYVKTKA